MKELWVEKYRPKKMEGYVWRDAAQRRQVETWVTEKSIPHLLLSGPPGIGKTTMAKILVAEIEILDALVDMLVVTIGAIHSAGFDAEGAWKEVMSTNFAKIDKKTGKVIKREDGKVLKPDGWTPPNLKDFLTRHKG